jgi:hypothetical protein
MKGDTVTSEDAARDRHGASVRAMEHGSCRPRYAFDEQ